MVNFTLCVCYHNLKNNLTSKTSERKQNSTERKLFSLSKFLYDNNCPPQGHYKLESALQI